MDALLAARRELAKNADLAPLLGSDAQFPLWLFRWVLQADVEGSGRAAVVLSTPSGWAAPNAHNTARFPRLEVEVYADVPRDDRLLPTVRTAQDYALAVFAVIDPVLHRVDRGGFTWGNSEGGMRIVRSVRQVEPAVEPVPDADGVARLSVAYAVSV